MHGRGKFKAKFCLNSLRRQIKQRSDAFLRSMSLCMYVRCIRCTMYNARLDCCTPQMSPDPLRAKFPSKRTTPSAGHGPTTAARHREFIVIWRKPMKSTCNKFRPSIHAGPSRADAVQTPPASGATLQLLHRRLMSGHLSTSGGNYRTQRTRLHEMLKREFGTEEFDKRNKV